MKSVEDKLSKEGVKRGHQTVLLAEAVEGLITDPDGFYVDGTYGRGGHSQAILAKLSNVGRLLVIDKDPSAIAHAETTLGGDSRVSIARGSFAQLPGFLQELGMQGQVQGLLLDLGVSSPQLDQAERGFSFSHDGPLDMRMDSEQGINAADWVNEAAAEEMADVFKEYGEERFAKRMARAIVEKRAEKPVARTGELAEIVAAANPAWEKGKHPATRVFQAIRIFINRELDDLQAGLHAALEELVVGGRLVVISFHSLEDRLVKRFMREQEKGKQLPRHVPVMDSEIKTRMKTLGKAFKPSEQEVSGNPRARSAVLRIAQKTA